MHTKAKECLSKLLVAMKNDINKLSAISKIHNAKLLVEVFNRLMLIIRSYIFVDLTWNANLEEKHNIFVIHAATKETRKLLKMTRQDKRKIKVISNIIFVIIHFHDIWIKHLQMMTIISTRFTRQTIYKVYCFWYLMTWYTLKTKLHNLLAILLNIQLLSVMS